MNKIGRFGDNVLCNPPIKLSKNNLYPNITMEKIIPFCKNIQDIDFEEYQGQSCSKFQKGDILMARITPCLENGKIAKYNLDYANAIGSTEFFVFRGIKNVSNTDYIYYLLCTKYMRNLSANSMTGASGRQRADIKFIKKIKWNFPKLEFQNKIASILSAYDDLIEVNNKKIKTLNEMAQEIYKEWFVRFRFPGHEKVEFQNGIPKGWEIVKLEKFGYDIESGNRPKGGIDTTLTNGIPSLGAEHIKTLGFFDYNDIKLISSDFYEQMKKGVGKDKNILLYKDGAYIGKVTIFMDDFPFKDYAVNEHVFLINAKEQAYQFYLYYTLNQTHYFLQMQNLNRNSAQPGLTPADLNILKLMKPEIKIVEKFNNVIHSILKNIFSLSKTNEKLKTQRDLLLPRLMSGKLEVKG